MTSKEARKKVQVLAKRYKSEVDSCCKWEIEIRLVRYVNDNNKVSYFTYKTVSFDDGANGKEYREPVVKEYPDLKTAKEQFANDTVGMYKNEHDELASMFRMLRGN